MVAMPESSIQVTSHQSLVTSHQSLFIPKVPRENGPLTL